jgi:hypothetical protein
MVVSIFRIWLPFGQLLIQGGVLSTNSGRKGDDSTPEEPLNPRRLFKPFFFFLTTFTMVLLSSRKAQSGALRENRPGLPRNDAGSPAPLHNTLLYHFL